MSEIKVNKIRSKNKLWSTVTLGDSGDTGLQFLLVQQLLTMEPRKQDLVEKGQLTGKQGQLKRLHLQQ